MSYRLGAIMLLCLLTASALPADEPPLAPREEILVLRNGHVIRGQVTRLGDRYLVTFGESGEVRLRAGDVEFQCGSIEEAYARKQNAIDPRNLRLRLELGEWCMRHDLLHRAADQVLAALAVNPFDARALALRRRLLHAAEAQRIAADSPSEVGADVDWAVIDETLASAPTGTIEMFASTVQPLLLNRCATNACHGSQANTRFRLLRPLTDSHTLPRRLTQRNLFATLQIVNVADPDNSPLLTVPRGPHGGEQQGLFSGRQEQQWEQLREWVQFVSESSTDGKQLRRGLLGSAARVDDAQESPPATVLRPTTAVAPSDEIHRSVFTSRPGANAASASSPPVDPFDPEVFNRRYFPEKSAPNTTALPAETTIER